MTTGWAPVGSACTEQPMHTTLDIAMPPSWGGALSLRTRGSPFAECRASGSAEPRSAQQGGPGVLRVRGSNG